MQIKKDYSFSTFLLAACVLGMLLAMGQIPPVKIAGLQSKRINILSDLYPAEEEVDDQLTEEYSDTTFQAESLAATSRTAMQQALSTPVGTSQSWDISPVGVVATPEAAVAGSPGIGHTYGTLEAIVAAQSQRQVESRVDLSTYAAPATLFEEFSPEGRGMDRFYSLLRNGNPKRAVRVAVLGDSFIEADIITADLREQLQQLFGGMGPGFIPFASPLAKYRASVKHTFEGWNTYNIIKKKSAPASVQDKFFVSGMVCIPTEGAWTRIEGNNFRQNISHCSVARLLFTNAGKSTIHVTINDTLSTSFTPESSPLVQQINLRGDIYSIKVRITSAAGFTGYGIVMESEHGVGVDNYSVRSNSGMALFGTNTAINSQIGKLLGYDLVILQYGLNAMSSNILSYKTYCAQLERIISYVRDCFPGATVMVMSVGDRSTQRNGEYVTMPAARAMLAAQHTAAENGRAVFWNTFQAMGGERSMVRFVQNKWASKDYTHIGYQGGKYIATELVRSLVYGYRKYNGDAIPTVDVPLPDYSLPAVSTESMPVKAAQATKDTITPKTADTTVTKIAQDTTKGSATVKVEKDTVYIKTR